LLRPSPGGDEIFNTKRYLHLFFPSEKIGLFIFFKLMSLYEIQFIFF